MFSSQFDVRFYETDALQHVSNTVLAGWFEAGREPIFRIFNPTLNLKHWPLIVASYKIDFLQQIFLGSPVEVKSWIGRIGSSSFDVYQEIWQNDQKKAKCTTTMVHYDYAKQASKAIEGEIRLALEAHMLPMDAGVA